MNELLKLADIVERILEENEDARNSDWSLYYAVCKFVNPSVVNAKFGTALKSHEAYGIPPFESVTRARRKVVETHPELIGTEEVEGGRWSYQKVFRQFAKECV